MFQKTNIFCLLIISSFFILIQCKEEQSKNILGKTKSSKSYELISVDSEPKVINIKCLFSKNYNFYSLQSIQDKDKDYEIKSGNYTFIFNFCQNTKTNSESTFLRKDSKGNIVKLTGSIDGEGEDKNQWLELGEGDKKEGISVALTKGEQCKEQPEMKYAANIIVHCDQERNEVTDFTVKKGNYDCVYTLEFTSRYGCPLGSIYLLLKLMEDYNYIFMVLMALIGLYLCFVGRKYLSYTIIGVCGIVCCYALTSLLISIFPNFITSELYLFICLLVCFILGLIVGYFLKDSVSIFVVLAGAALGYSFVTFFYQIIQTYVNWDPEILYYVSIGVCVLAGGAIGYYFSEPILILGLSVFGGYLVMRGVSLVAGNYLDETMTIDLIRNKEWDQLEELRTPWIYAYLGSWLVLSFVGTIIQCRYHRQDKAKNQDALLNRHHSKKNK